MSRYLDFSFNSFFFEKETHSNMEPSEELILRQGHERRDACRLIREMGEDLEMPTACSSAALVIYHAYRQVHLAECTELE